MGPPAGIAYRLDPTPLRVMPPEGDDILEHDIPWDASFRFEALGDDEGVCPLPDGLEQLGGDLCEFVTPASKLFLTENHVASDDVILEKEEQGEAPQSSCDGRQEPGVVPPGADSDGHSEKGESDGDGALHGQIS